MSKKVIYTAYDNTLIAGVTIFDTGNLERGEYLIHLNSEPSGSWVRFVVKIRSADDATTSILAYYINDVISNPNAVLQSITFHCSLLENEEIEVEIENIAATTTSTRASIQIEKRVTV